MTNGDREQTTCRGRRCTQPALAEDPCLPGSSRSPSLTNATAYCRLLFQTIVTTTFAVQTLQKAEKRETDRKPVTRHDVMHTSRGVLPNILPSPDTRPLPFTQPSTNTGCDASPRPQQRQAPAGSHHHGWRRTERGHAPSPEAHDRPDGGTRVPRDRHRGWDPDVWAHAPGAVSGGPMPPGGRERQQQRTCSRGSEGQVSSQGASPWARRSRLHHHLRPHGRSGSVEIQTGVWVPCCHTEEAGGAHAHLPGIPAGLKLRTVFLERREADREPLWACGVLGEDRWSPRQCWRPSGHTAGCAPLRRVRERRRGPRGPHDPALKTFLTDRRQGSRAPARRSRQPPRRGPRPSLHSRSLGFSRHIPSGPTAAS